MGVDPNCGWPPAPPKAASCGSPLSAVETPCMPEIAFKSNEPCPSRLRTGIRFDDAAERGYDRLKNVPHHPCRCSKLASGHVDLVGAGQGRVAVSDAQGTPGLGLDSRIERLAIPLLPWVKTSGSQPASAIPTSKNPL